MTRKTHRGKKLGIKAYFVPRPFGTLCNPQVCFPTSGKIHSEILRGDPPPPPGKINKNCLRRVVTSQPLAQCFCCEGFVQGSSRNF